MSTWLSTNGTDPQDGVNGVVIDATTGQGFGRARVEALSGTTAAPLLIDATLADEDGRFQMALETAYRVQLFQDEIVHVLFFRVFDQERLISNSDDSPTW